jgi:RNA polymerase sigma-70 factor (ECF subfamily)
MKINETNYIEQLKKKNEKALLYVIDEYGGLLKAVIRKHLCGYPHLQEECLNDVLLGIWQHSNSYDESKNSFKNWIAAIARYQSIDYIRKHAKEQIIISLEDLGVEPQSDSIQKTNELTEEMEKLLLCLKPVDQEIFKKLYIEECSAEETSRQLRMKKSTLYNRVSRAKKKLFRIYSEKGDC